MNRDAFLRGKGKHWRLKANNDSEEFDITSNSARGRGAGARLLREGIETVDQNKN
jgi:hypothetical protein